MITETVTLTNGQLIPKHGEELKGGGMKTATKLRQKAHDGVSPRSAVARPVTEEQPRWYLMRVAYGQEKKASDFLIEKEGVEEVFCPQWYQERTLGGKRKRVLVSLVPNMLFVKSTLAVLRQFVGVPPTHYLHHYYQPYKDESGRDIESGRRPMVIPEGQMWSFRKWFEADADDKIYIQDTFQFKQDDIVRVVEGEFAGFTGHVVRLKGQTRVGVNINGVGFICTTYIPRYCLEKVEERENVGTKERERE